MAGLYVLLGADFLAAAQLLIYVGGILVLLLFGVMLTHKIYDLDFRSGTNQFWQGLTVAVVLFVIFTFAALRTQWAVGLAGARADDAPHRRAVPGRSTCCPSRPPRCCCSSRSSARR